MNGIVRSVATLALVVGILFLLNWADVNVWPAVGPLLNRFVPQPALRFAENVVTWAILSGALGGLLWFGLVVWPKNLDHPQRIRYAKIVIVGIAGWLFLTTVLGLRIPERDSEYDDVYIPR